MSARRIAVVLLAGAAALLGDRGRVVAHDVADLEFVPKLDRFALAAAYRRGGEVERANLEAAMLPIPGADEGAVQLLRDLDGDGDPDEIHFHLEVIEIQSGSYLGEDDIVRYEDVYDRIQEIKRK